MDEYLELKDKLGPLEKRLDEVRDRLRDLVTEHGHFIDEVRGVSVHVEPRFRKEYDAGSRGADQTLARRTKGEARGWGYDGG